APAQETSGGRIEALRAEARIMESASFREHQLPEIDRWIETEHPHLSGGPRGNVRERAVTPASRGRAEKVPTNPNASAPRTFTQKTGSSGMSSNAVLHLKLPDPPDRQVVSLFDDADFVTDKLRWDSAKRRPN